MSQKIKWIYKLISESLPKHLLEIPSKAFLDLKHRISGRWPDKKTAVRLYTTSFFL